MPSFTTTTTPTNPREYKQMQPTAERTLSTSSTSSTSSDSSFASSSSSSPSTSSSSSSLSTSSSTSSRLQSPTLPTPNDMLHHLSLRMPFSLHHPSSAPPSPTITALHSDPHQSSSSQPSQSSSSSQPQPTTTTTTSQPSSPTYPPFSSLTSPLSRYRRAPSSPSDSPPLQINSTPSKHTLQVQFPQAMGMEMKPEMVTICAKRGDKLSIVADAWHLERNCHYEWEVSFPPHDADMAHVQAKFLSGGCLTIDVWRR